MRYDFKCDSCKTVTEIAMSITEHEEKKNNIFCKICNSKMIQCVNKLNFRLVGNGWFDQGYGITQQEMNVNLDDEKRLEEVANNHIEHDRQNL